MGLTNVANGASSLPLSSSQIPFPAISSPQLLPIDLSDIILTLTVLGRAIPEFGPMKFREAAKEEAEEEEEEDVRDTAEDGRADRPDVDPWPKFGR
jgi:hypothetical protein